MKPSFPTATLRLLVLALPAVGASAGMLQIAVRDADTHYAVSPSIRLEGPESLTADADQHGIFRRNVANGDYRIQFTANRLPKSGDALDRQ